MPQNSNGKKNTQITIHERMEIILKFLNSGLSEKEEAVRLSLLALMAGESLFFIGPPGTAKSMISRRLKDIFKDSNDKNYFEYLLNEFSTPDELFGPVSLKELESDNYKRITDGYLPNADIAFLDEIWKAGPAILNTLLTIINEKKFHNGNNVEDVPLLALIAASNELPENNRGLEALWDRFVIRLKVDSIKEENVFLKMIQAPENKDLIPSDRIKEILITKKELEVNQIKIDKIEIPQTIQNVITAIRKDLLIQNNQTSRSDNEKYYISDRRWKKIVHILRTSAFLNGREEVDLMDASLIQYCIWGTDKQIEESKQIVAKLIQDYGLECSTAIDDINDEIAEFEKSIDETWYEKKIITKAKKGEPIIETLNDDRRNKEKCNKVQDSNGDIYYIGIDKSKSHSSYNSEYYNIYNASKIYKEYREKDASDNDNEIIDIDGEEYTIMKTPEIKEKEGLVKKTPIFDTPAAYKATKKTFDKEKYNPIKVVIEQEIKELRDYKKKMEVPFRKNLFTEQDFADVILTKINSAANELEDSKISLDKQQARYEK